jgi:hypothetical protein
VKEDRTMTKRTKYPRTHHLPWTRGATKDDKILGSVKHFEGKQVVVTEKADGENTTIYNGGYMHARSVDSKSHPSQSIVRALAAQVGMDIPEGWRVCGENCYAQHSISYAGLPSYFLVFAIYDENNNCLPWSETVEWAALLGLETVPVLYEGVWDEEAVKACYKVWGRLGGLQEGYVVRFASGFKYDKFRQSAAKFVRADHVQEGGKHWRATEIVPNLTERSC